MLSRSLVALLFVLQLASPALAEQFTGRVVGVSDGDTISVLSSGKAVKVRLHGVDAPESAQAFGTRAKQTASEMVFGKDVTVRVENIDRYGRTVGEVILSDGRSLNRELVRDGMAWWYRPYARKDTELGRLESQARETRRGLWTDKEPTPPWEFRKTKKTATRSVSRQSKQRNVSVDRLGEMAERNRDGAGRTTAPPAMKIPPSAGGDDSEQTSGLLYMTPSGSRYHRARCRSIGSRGERVSLSQVQTRDIRPCGICKP